MSAYERERDNGKRQRENGVEIELGRERICGKERDLLRERESGGIEEVRESGGNRG